MTYNVLIFFTWKAVQSCSSHAIDIASLIFGFSSTVEFSGFYDNSNICE